MIGINTSVGFGIRTAIRVPYGLFNLPFVTAIEIEHEYISKVI